MASRSISTLKVVKRVTATLPQASAASRHSSSSSSPTSPISPATSTPTLHSNADFTNDNHGMKANVENAELAKFRDLDWWDPNGCQRMLHRMNPTRVQLVKDALKDKPLRNARICDVGCGAGLLSEALARLGADVTGVDAEKKCVDLAKKHWEEVTLGRMCSGSEMKESMGKLRYVHGTAEELVAKGEQFDLVIASEVIEHVPDPRGFAQTLKQLANNDAGSSVLITTVARNMFSYFLTIVMAEKILNILPNGMHEYSKYVTPSELEGYFVDSKFGVASEGPIIYDPIRSTFETTRPLVARDQIYVNYWSTFHRR